MTASIKRYHIYSDDITTRRAVFPQNQGCQELCTLADGFTYISIPTGVILPDQPPEITIEDVVLTDELIQSIKDASPQVRLIRTRVREAIEEKYSISDEIKLIRTQPSEAFDAYNSYAEACRQAGRDKVTDLGLISSGKGK